MAWPEHPYITVYMVVRSPAERTAAERAIAHFYWQDWPVKQLVIVNATAVPFGDDPQIKELRLRGQSLGAMKNAAIMAADGEWCFPWPIDAWYDSNYLTFMMRGAEPTGAVALKNPLVEAGDRSIETTLSRVSFFGFFKHRLNLPSYGDDGSDNDFLKRLEKPQIVQQVEPVAKLMTSASDIHRYQERPKVAPVKKGSVCVVQLGRYGDITNILPICLHIYNSYGKPYLMVSRNFAGILDGVSYVEPFIVDLNDNQLLEGLAIANDTFEHVVQTQIWGQNYVQDKQCDSYNREMWRMGGFLAEFENKAWMPLFDRMDPPEEALSYLDGRPLILTNLTCGASSPFPEGHHILNRVMDRWGKRYQVLEIGTVRLKHVYALLHLIRAAKVMVSIDTVLLHLGAVTTTPTVALVNVNPWLGTVPRGHVIDRMTYQQACDRPERVNDAIGEALVIGHADGGPIVGPTQHGAPKRRIFHVVATYEEPSPSERKRKQYAVDSWQRLYDQGVIPCYYTDWKRWGQHIGAKTKLPFLKDTLQVAMEKADWNDIIFYTNDDIVCHPNLPQQLRFYCSLYGAVAGRRCEIPFAPPPGPTQSPQDWAAQNKNELFTHEGRDMFAFTKSWLRAHWDEIPDFYIGSTEWDNCVVIMIRRERGYLSRIKDLKPLLWPAEMPLGWTAHVRHRSFWQSPVNFAKSPANIHNRQCFRDWAAQHAKHLSFTDDNQLIEIR